MLRQILSLIPLLSLFVVPAASRPHARQCQGTLDTASTITRSLQSHYFNAAAGSYNRGFLWTDANTLEDIHNLMLAAGSTEWNALADGSTIGRQAAANANWDGFLNGSWDDAQWIILAMWKIADYKNAHGQDASAYMNGARTIYNIVAGQWDDTCGGGVWWSAAHTYKNAITNQLFLLTSAQGSKRYNDAGMKANAQKAWIWLSSSGIRNAQGLWNDGLDTATCKNNGQTTWIYNQGVIASGLGELASITGDNSLLNEAEVTLDATIAHLTDNGVLKEVCDDVVHSTCDTDQQIFKGIWMKHVQYYLDVANDAGRVFKYSNFLGAQESAVLHFGTNGNGDIGNVWYAPSQGGSLFTAPSSASGIAAHVSAAKYGPC